MIQLTENIFLSPGEVVAIEDYEFERDLGGSPSGCIIERHWGARVILKCGRKVHVPHRTAKTIHTALFGRPVAEPDTDQRRPK